MTKPAAKTGRTKKIIDQAIDAALANKARVQVLDHDKNTTDAALREMVLTRITERGLEARAKAVHLSQGEGVFVYPAGLPG